MIWKWKRLIELFLLGRSRQCSNRKNREKYVAHSRSFPRTHTHTHTHTKINLFRGLAHIQIDFFFKTWYQTNLYFSPVIYVCWINSEIFSLFLSVSFYFAFCTVITLFVFPQFLTFSIIWKSILFIFTSLCPPVRSSFCYFIQFRTFLHHLNRIIVSHLGRNNWFLSRGTRFSSWGEAEGTESP